MRIAPTIAAAVIRPAYKGFMAIVTVRGRTRIAARLISQPIWGCEKVVLVSLTNESSRPDGVKVNAERSWRATWQLT